MSRGHIRTSAAVRLLVFVLGAALAIVISFAIAGSLGALIRVSGQFASMALTSAVLATLLLVLSKVLMQHEGAPLAVIGIAFNRKNARHLTFGFALTAALYLGVSFVQSTIVGAPWMFQGTAGISAATTGLALVLALVLAEEFMGAVFRFLMPTLGGLLFGWAAVRSGGLALPIGLHLGGNWVQASIAGFAPTGATASSVTG